MRSSLLFSPGNMTTRDRESAPLVSRDGTRAVVWLAGEHDIATAAVLADTLANVVSTDDADVIVDLSDVTFMSTATIDVLLRGRNLLLRQSRTFTLRSPSRCVRRLLGLCGLAGLIEPSRDATPVVPSLAKAFVAH